MTNQQYITLTSHCFGSASDNGAHDDILRVLFYLFFPGGGIGRYTHELLQRLQQDHCIETELACLPSYHWRTATGYSIWPGLFEISDRVPLRRRTRFLIAQFINPSRLMRRAAANRAQIVHLSNINHLTYSFWKRLVPTRRKLKLVATVHDVKRAKPIIHGGYEQRQLYRFYREADALFVHSFSQRDELRSCAGVDSDRIHIVPHGLYDYGPPSGTRAAIRARLGLDPSKTIALFFGMIRDDKNLELLIRALQPSSPVHLLVAGRGDGGRHKSIEYYQSLVNQLSLNNNVTFINRYIPDNEVADLFEASDWVALPYSRTFTSQSGVLNVAAAYNRPVLASGAATFTETLSQCDVGLVVEPDDERALAEGVRAMTSRLAAGHAHEFRKYRQLFSWEESARRTTEVYRQLCRQSSQSHIQ